jgi:hypothetical protein
LCILKNRNIENLYRYNYMYVNKTLLVASIIQKFAKLASTFYAHAVFEIYRRYNWKYWQPSWEPRFESRIQWARMSRRVRRISISDNSFGRLNPGSNGHESALGLTLYVNNEFECFIRGSKHEKTVWNTSAKRECFIVFECLVPW